MNRIKVLYHRMCINYHGSITNSLIADFTEEGEEVYLKHFTKMIKHRDKLRVLETKGA